MNRLETVTEIAQMCGDHPYVAVSVVGWLTAMLDTEDLAACLDWAREVRDEWSPAEKYLTLVDERYGQSPPQRP